LFEEKNSMKKSVTFLFVLLLTGLFLVACTTAQPQADPTPAAQTGDTQIAAPTPAPQQPPATGRTRVRWFVGLGTGTDPAQITVQEEVVEAFNRSQNEIELVLEVVPYDAARDTLSTQIASGNGPDIIGPVGWGGSNAFYGQWLDIGPLIQQTGFDTSVFDPALVEFYQTEEGQVGLPFAVFPAAVYYIPAYFDEVGLAYPPERYGEQYELDGRMVEWNWDTFTEVARRLTIDVNGRTANEAGFDRDQIVQVGYSPQWQTHVAYVGSYVAGGAAMYEGNARGEYRVAIPDNWKEAMRWYYEGMWGDQPFIPTGPLSAAPEFGAGNVFNTGKAAMAVTPLWYTCCLWDLKGAGVEFQAAALPVGANGSVNGRVDADTFRIWKGTRNPEAAFTVLSYLLTTGADTLLPIYGAMPAIPEKQDAFFAVKSQDYPFVTDASWNVFRAGLSYPDIPSAEQYQPNYNEAWSRQQTFLDLLNNTPPTQIDFDAEWQRMIDDLNRIYNQ
jgi:multiple sugar transport system substrate-binding protein